MKEFSRILFTVLLIVCAVFVTFAGGQKDDSGPIKVGHLSYHTGPFADVGPWFDGMTEVALEAINEYPPLGREMVVVNQDIGTIGEAQAARKLIEKEGVEVLLNPAHEYLSYRDWMLSYVKENDSPLMPSVHGAGIQGDIGGTPEEPIFRGSPMDSGQAVAAVLKAYNEGAERIVLLATEIEGSQMMMEAAKLASNALGLNIVDAIDVQPEQTDYRSEIARIANSNPDCLLAFSQAQDGGTIVKQAAEAGMSLKIIGTTEWLGEAFAASATENAMNQHKGVWISGFSYVDNAAYADYAPRWLSSKYADLAPVDISYNIQYWDVLIVTALAIEAAGSTKASAWAPKVKEVSMAPGKKVFTYADGIAALRAGEDIDYSGVTGEFNYNNTGMVTGLYGIFKWRNGHLIKVEDINGDDVLKYDLMN